jgi:hypothetical protein
MSSPFAFAWAGGTIADQVTLVINGTTYGARNPSVTLVGDVQVGHQQLINVSDTGGLAVGTLYSVSDSAGTAYFIYDDTTLAGLPNSINLTAAPDFSAQSATFVATQSDILGVALGTLSQGSNGVSLADVAGLPAGLYAIAGTGIGETNTPVGTIDGTTHTTGGGITIVGTAFLDYHGGGSGNMFLIAATPHTHLGFDGFGNPISQTTWTIAEQPVLATTSGTFPVEIFGFATGDPYTIDNIPPGALTDMTPGLLYNISGNGIETGTLCQTDDNATLTLDLAATSSELTAILTITGPRTPNAPFDPAVHNRFDEDIISVEIAQEEGGFATLTAGLKNPNIGLLAFGRNLWCWLSWDQAWTPDGSSSPDLVPLFNGRLVGVPKLQAGEIVQLEFLARPDDFNYQKMQLAAALSVLPYYDPVWLTTATVATSPDAVLETYSALWHIDRATLAVTTSDILNGEDGTLDIGEDQSIYDNFSLTYGQPPLAAINVSATVTWQQQAEGTIDVTQYIINAFHAAGSKYYDVFPVDRWRGEAAGGGGLIQVLCGDGIESDWPRPGTSAGGGWTLATRNDHSGYPLNYIIEATQNARGGYMPLTYYTISYAGQLPALIPSTGSVSTDQHNAALVTVPYGQYRIQFPLNVYKVRMNLDFRANRTRTETLNAVVAAGVQRVLSDSAESDRQDLNLTSDYVDKGIDPNGNIPIGSVAYRSYLQSDRGNASVQYALLLARAKLRARVRAVEITFAVPWQAALGITLRHNVQLTDYRLPGGQAIGKVKGYKLSVSDGKMLGEFTLGCSVGTAETMTPQMGINAWVNDGYVNPGYQRMVGAQISVGEGDLACQTLDDFVVVDDGLDLTNLTASQAVNECVVTNGVQEQVSKIAPFKGSVAPTFGDPIGVMEKLTTTCTLDLKPVQGSAFHTEFFPAVTQLTLPKTINLAATSGG